MQQAISDSPFLPICIEGHSFVIEAYDLAAALPMLMIEETNGIADGHFMSAQASLRIIPDGHIDTIKIDGGVGDQPVLAGVCFTNQHFLGSELAHLRRAKLVCTGKRSAASAPATSASSAYSPPMRRSASSATGCPPGNACKSKNLRRQCARQASSVTPCWNRALYPP